VIFTACTDLLHVEPCSDEQLKLISSRRVAFPGVFFSTTECGLRRCHAALAICVGWFAQ
jgi:hypothetical protein